MPPKKKYSSDFKGWINRKLNDAEKAQFLAWDFHDDEVWLFLAQAEQEGYKFSHSWNKSNSTFNAVFICTDENSPNAGYGMSAYSPDWYASIRLLLFKHIVVFQYTWDIKGIASPEDNWG